MNNQSKINSADLYALREFLVRYCASTDSQFSLPNQYRTSELFGAERYVFTHINPNKGFLDFQLRRTKMFKYYDLVDFAYSDGTIKVVQGEVLDETDKSKVRNLANILESRCYGNLISNLDQLIG